MDAGLGSDSGLQFIEFTVTNSQNTSVTGSFIGGLSTSSAHRSSSRSGPDGDRQPALQSRRQQVRHGSQYARRCRCSYSAGLRRAAGASIDPTTGVLTWTPASYQTGSYSFTVTVSDSQTPPLTVSDTFTVKVSALPPVLDADPDPERDHRHGIDGRLRAVRLEPQQPAFVLDLQPGRRRTRRGVHRVREFTWTPGVDAAVGRPRSLFDVTNESTPPVTATFTVNVAAAPIVAPAIASIPVEIATVGTTFTLNVSQYASDPNTPALSLSYSLGAGAPSGASIDPSSGILTWTPPSGQAVGAYPFTVDVTDNASPAEHDDCGLHG